MIATFRHITFARAQLAALICGVLSIGCVTNESISARAAVTSVSNYEAAKRNGLVGERCQFARLAMRLYLQAQDDNNMLKWKEIAEEDCKVSASGSNRGRIGVNLAASVPMDVQQRLESNKGAFVQSVNPNSPAFRANILAGDVIIEIDGKEFTSFGVMQSIVAEACKTKGIVKVSVVRGDKKRVDLSVAACD
jgi:membrane-associated protease RseP (regulator of RpoE activity)